MRHLTALALALTLLGSASAADIYCNNQGKDCSDKPTPGAVLVHIANNSYGSNTLSTPAAGSERARDNTSTDAANARLSQEHSAQAVQKDVASTRATQCKDAQEKYTKSVEARRVYRMGKDGEREYLSDSEADQMRLNARLEMERSCAKSSG